MQSEYQTQILCRGLPEMKIGPLVLGPTLIYNQVTTKHKRGRAVTEPITSNNV